MFRIYLLNNKLYVFDKSEKEFRAKYGTNFEQISVVKDQDNIDSVCEKLLKQNNASEIIKDCKIKKKFGWKYFSDEVKDRIRKSISVASSRYIKTKEHGEAISRAKKGKKTHSLPHSEHSKKLISYVKRMQKIDPIKGRKWMHNPITGEERRDYELYEGMVWGRSPESREYTASATRARQIARQQKYKG